ncbi:hypothetical protein FHL15_004427 [Xylaria flabelliformis]|uniref:Heterokaryon incompatibility domain-containing protein n=1 Tax=Xylaria flabelliformis TaxID=2512241 RepID=A0A553I374_9PEZI|nr:hypothetical protein FHL15_004427 [Xylaria flabelliformis]
MGDIYDAAYHTVVFLGDDISGSQALFQHLLEVDFLISLNYKLLRYYPEPSKEIIRELEHLLRRPWFSRVWVIQEAIRSRNVTFMCGRQNATIEALTSCLHAFTPLCDPSPEITDLVNYEQETESIFHKFAVLFLHDGGLALLWMIRHPHHNERMPSWVPDWNNNKGKSHRTKDIPMFFDFYDSDQFTSNYRNFLLERVNGHSLASQSLVVGGVRRGYIHALSPEIKIEQEDIQTRINSVRTWFDGFMSMKHGSPLPKWPDSIAQGPGVRPTSEPRSQLQRRNRMSRE